MGYNLVHVQYPTGCEGMMGTTLNGKTRFVACGLWLVVCSLWLVACKQEGKAEPTLIIKNPLHDYAGEVRSGVYKMVSSEVPVNQIRFNDPENLTLLRNTKFGVFHPKGAGATYKKITQREILEDSSDGRWLFSGELAIPMMFRKKENDRLPDDSEQLSEIIAFLPGLKKDVCQKINKQIGIDGIPKLLSDQSSFYKKEMVDGNVNNYVLPDTKQPYLNNAAFKGQPFGCFETYAGAEYVYYDILFER